MRPFASGESGGDRDRAARNSRTLRDYAAYSLAAGGRDTICDGGDTLLDRSASRWGAAALIGLIAIAFRGGINVAFLSDDYVLAALAANPPAAWWRLFAEPGGDGFFRPLGYLSMYATGWIAGDDARTWHAAALAIHTVSALLVWRLSSLLMPPARAWIAASLFAIHASRPEAVVWIAGRFDLVATMFVLLGLSAFAERRTRAAAICTLLAALSKESGFAFPFLAMIWARLEGDSWRQGVSRNRPLIAVALAAFAYRWWILGGIGGYAGGLSLVAAAKALFVRLWVVLAFPVNWSRPLSFAAAAALAALLVSLLFFRALPRPLFALFTIMSALPAVQQLLIGDDLQKARLLYLPALGFCWMMAASVRLPLAGIALWFHFAVLQHNVAIWRSVGEQAEASCAHNARLLQSGAQLREEPGSIHGVYFFANGLRECVEARIQRARTGTLD